MVFVMMTMVACNNVAGLMFYHQCCCYLYHLSRSSLSCRTGSLGIGFWHLVGVELYLDWYIFYIDTEIFRCSSVLFFSSSFAWNLFQADISTSISFQSIYLVGPARMDVVIFGAGCCCCRLRPAPRCMAPAARIVSCLSRCWAFLMVNQLMVITAFSAHLQAWYIVMKTSFRKSKRFCI